MKRIAALLMTSVVCLPAFAGGLPSDVPVRIVGSGIEDGWFEGKTAITSAGCTVVKLSKATKDGYILLALIAVNRLQEKDGDQWRDLSVSRLKAQEPSSCLKEGSD